MIVVIIQFLLILFLNFFIFYLHVLLLFGGGEGGGGNIVNQIVILILLTPLVHAASSTETVRVAVCTTWCIYTLFLTHSRHPTSVPVKVSYSVANGNAFMTLLQQLMGGTLNELNVVPVVILVAVNFS